MLPITLINVCKEQDIGIIILGYNNYFQYKTGMGKKQNKIFSHVAFKKFKEKLEYKCKIYDITIIFQEESYTSKSSFLDNDKLPIYQPNNNKKYEFKGIKLKEDSIKQARVP